MRNKRQTKSRCAAWTAALTSPCKYANASHMYCPPPCTALQHVLSSSMSRTTINIPLQSRLVLQSARRCRHTSLSLCGCDHHKGCVCSTMARHAQASQPCSYDSAPWVIPTQTYTALSRTLQWQVRIGAQQTGNYCLCSPVTTVKPFKTPQAAGCRRKAAIKSNSNVAAV